MINCIHRNHIIHIMLNIWMATFALSGLSAQMEFDGFPVEEIRETLELTDDQVERFKSIQSSHAKSFSALEDRIEGLSDQDQRMALVNEMRTLMKNTMSKVENLLSQEQFQKLLTHMKGFDAEKMGAHLGEMMANMQQRLKLSMDQFALIQPLMAVYQPPIRELMTELSAADGFRQRRKVGSQMRDLRGELDDEIKAILTKEQYEEWEKMSDERRTVIREQMENRSN